MKIIFGIIRYIFTSLGVMFAILILLFLFGSLKQVEPGSVNFSDGKTLEFATPANWCGVNPKLYELAKADMPKNELIIKKKGCKIKEIAGPVGVGDLIRVQAYKVTEAANEVKLLTVCAEKNQYGLTAFQDSGSIFCVSPEQEGLRGVTAFTKFGDDHLAISTLIIAPGEDAEKQTKELIELVKSYKFK